MQPADAVGFFRAQGIRGTRAEIDSACAPYGYHPLSLRLLAGLIVGDFQQPGDIAAATRLDVSGDLVQRQHHVLEMAYDSLRPARQALLGRIACFRGPVRYEALKALAATPKSAEAQTGKSKKKAPTTPRLAVSASDLDSDLQDLVARGLLHHDTKEGRFDLHPIVRRYAYDRLDAPDRAAAHARLRDYFAAVPVPDKVRRVEDLAPIIELYHHTVRAEQFDAARTLYRDRLEPLSYQFGAYQLIIDLMRTLFPKGEDYLPRLKDENARGWTLNEMAISYIRSGHPRRAMPLFEHMIDIAGTQGEDGKNNLDCAMGNMAEAQMKIGALGAADTSLRRNIALNGEANNEYNGSIAHRELGLLLAYCGAYAESETELAKALKTWQEQKDARGQCLVWTYRALRQLLRLRSVTRATVRNPQSAVAPARRALKLADETARTIYPVERDYVRVHWIVGAAQRTASRASSTRPSFTCTNRWSAAAESELSTSKPAFSLTWHGCTTPPARRTRRSGWLRRRSSSPSAVAMSCKARMPTSDSRSSRSLAVTSPPLAITPPKPAASPPATARPITHTKPSTTKRVQC